MNTRARLSLPPAVRSALLGIAVGVVVGTLLLLLAALAVYRLDIPRTFALPLSLVALGMGGLLGGLCAGLCAGQKGLLIGAVCGTAWYLILLLAGLARVGGVAPGYAALKWAVLTASAAAGGIWGVNRR